MTLNGVIAFIFLHFTEFDSFACLFYVTVVKDYCLQNIVFHFWPKLIHPAAQSLCDS